MLSGYCSPCEVIQPVHIGMRNILKDIHINYETDNFDHASNYTDLICPTRKAYDQIFALATIWYDVLIKFSYQTDRSDRLEHNSLISIDMH